MAIGDKKILGTQEYINTENATQNGVIASKLDNSNQDQTKLGSLTIGESITVTNWEYASTTITIDAASHKAKIGDTIYVSGLVADVGDAPNGTHTVTAITATSIDYVVAVEPTATADTGTTVSGALVKYGDLKNFDDLSALFDGGKSLTTNGYQILSSGLIIQWLEFSYSSTATFNFPIAFPNACLSATFSALTFGSNNIGIQSFTATGVTVGDETITASPKWVIAIGH